MKGQTKTTLCAIVLAMMGTGILCLALAPRKPDWIVVGVVGVFALGMQAGAIALAFMAIRRWSYGRAGLKGRLEYALELRGATLLQVSPIRGRGPGLLQLLITNVGSAEGVRCKVRIVDLTPVPGAPVLATDNVRSFNIGAARPVDLFVDHRVRHAGNWELMVEVTWEESLFRTGLLRTRRQFSRPILIELIVCGHCTDVSVPTHPIVEAAPLDEERRGFEVILKR